MHAGRTPGAAGAAGRGWANEGAGVRRVRGLKVSRPRLRWPSSRLGRDRACDTQISLCVYLRPSAV
jgi:hypothetical protein